ncbi:60S ribosomal protein L24 [Ceratobasidium sp. 395]|nr:60S ribosomal protein L24 [Ceratobasidium sp. 395]
MVSQGIAEETVKKRSRKTVKHQRGIVGADLAAIAAKRNQSAADRTAARSAAIAKAKQEKKSKEDAKTKAKAPAARAPTGAPKAPKQAKGGKGR